MGSAFTYQGRLQNAGASANGAYDLRFRGSYLYPELCDRPSAKRINPGLGAASLNSS